MVFGGDAKDEEYGLKSGPRILPRPKDYLKLPSRHVPLAAQFQRRLVDLGGDPGIVKVKESDLRKNLRRKFVDIDHALYINNTNVGLVQNPFCAE